MNELERPIITEEANHPVLTENNVRLLIRREDLLDPITGGNKWRKLHFNMMELKRKENQGKIVVTFGGAFSNHIAATARSGSIHGIKTAGIIRGEKPDILSLTLRRADEDGMDLFFTERHVYMDKTKALQPALAKYGHEHIFVIPEGGNNANGFKGCCEILTGYETDFDFVFCPCANGTTLAGLTATLKPHQQAAGVLVLNNRRQAEQNVRQFLLSISPEQLNFNFSLNDDYTFGGYARSNRELLDFVNEFHAMTGIPCEPVYTGKMFYAIMDLVAKKHFKPGTTLLAIHTGGMQYTFKN